jgi:peptide/nickel transport system permease protein
VPIAFGVTVIAFMLVHLAPGDPISAIMPADATPQMIADARHEYGLDRPLPVQYFVWLDKALHGQFGNSPDNGRPIAVQIAEAIRNTALLSACAGLLACVTGFILGMTAGIWRNRLADHVVNALTVLSISIPHYWLAIVLVIIFAVDLGWLPPFGIGDGTPGDWWLNGQQLRHLVLPCIALSVTPAAVIARTMRASLIETLDQEFVTTLQAKGLNRARQLWHVIVNAMPTTLAVAGLQLGHMIAGSVLVETVFAWPGTGFLLAEAIFNRDLPLLQGTMLVLSLFFVVLNLLVDLLQSAIDPRVRRS